MTTSLRNLIVSRAKQLGFKVFKEYKSKSGSAYLSFKYRGDEALIRFSTHKPNPFRFYTLRNYWHNVDLTKKERDSFVY